MRPRHARRSRLPAASVALAIAAIIAPVLLREAPRERAGEPAAGDREPEATSPVGGPSSPDRPTGSPSPSPPRRAIVIQGTGDVSLDPAYIPALQARGYAWAWSGLEGVFRRDDLTVINLECPPTDVVAPVPKTFSFRCDPEALLAARRAGVEVASLANNHAFDQGPDGLLDGLENLREAGITPIGAGRSARAADAPRVVEVGGWRIGLLGVGRVIDPESQVAVGRRAGTAVGHDFPRALRAIRRAERSSDIVVVVIHWGVELDTRPRPEQVAQARRMIGAGADVIFGHHAHRLQPMRVIDGRPVFFGLGNFVWPRLSEAGSRTAVARVVIRPDGTIRGRLVPATIVSSGHPVLDA